MTIIIDHDRAIELLERAVEGREDFVYDREVDPASDEPRCVYVEGGKPSCLIAQALHLAGVTVEQLKLLEDPDWQSRNTHGGGYSIRFVDLPEGLEITDEGREIFATAQGDQDYSEPWGRALESARHAHARVTTP